MYKQHNIISKHLYLTTVSLVEALHADTLNHFGSQGYQRLHILILRLLTVCIWHDTLQYPCWANEGVNDKTQDIEVVRYQKVWSLKWDRVQKSLLGLELDVLSLLEELLLCLSTNTRKMLSDDWGEDFVDLLGYLPDLRLETVVFDEGVLDLVFEIWDFLAGFDVTDLGQYINKEGVIFIWTHEILDGLALCYGIWSSWAIFDFS